MSEYNIGIMACIALAVCVVDCLFWMFGGRSDKWLRRYIGSFIQTLGLNIISLIMGVWAWQYLLTFITETASRSLGYGGDTTGEKILKRSIFALGSLASGVILAWGVGFTGGTITLLICQVVASVISIILGLKNPLPAAVEEVFVCISLKYINYGYIFVPLVK